jgi:hypothetical protein
VHDLRKMYHRLRNCFGCTGWYSWVVRLKWKLVSVRLETLLVSVQEWSSEIVLDAPDGTPKGRGSNGSSFRSVWI